MRDPKAGFDLLYWQARDALIRFSLDREPDEARWLSDWILASDAEYDGWESKPMLRGYLDLVARSPSRGCALIGYVYLHLGYSLPRLLANTVRQKSSLPLERCWRLFMDASAIIPTLMFVQPEIRQATSQSYLDMLRACPKQARMCGLFAILFIMPGGLSAAHTVCNWVLAQRSSAWAVASRLSRTANSAEAEERLCKGLEDAVKHTFLHPNPLNWIRSLPLAYELIAEPAPAEMCVI